MSKKWDVQAGPINHPAIAEALEDGGEPFAAQLTVHETDNGQPQAVWHIAVKVPVSAVAVSPLDLSRLPPRGDT